MKKEPEASEIRRTRKLSIIEGSAASVTLGFGEQYIVPLALKLGGTGSQIAYLSSIPFFIGSLFQLAGAKLLNRLHNRKMLVSWFVLLQALTFLPLLLVFFLELSFYMLFTIFTLYMIFGSIVVPVWSSWLGDLVPRPERGRYFGLRNKMTIFVLMGSIVAGGLVLKYIPNLTGFAIVFGIAVGGRLLSFLLLLRHAEPQYHADIWNDYSFMDFLREINRSAFGSFTVFRSFIAFSVMLCSPFFAVLMLNYLGFSFLQYSIIIIVPMAVKAFAATYWGSMTNRFGNRNLMKASAALIWTIPLYWLVIVYYFPEKAFYLLVLGEGISGFAWAGLELTTFNYMLDSSSTRKRATLFSYYAVVFGFMVFLGGSLGGLLQSSFSLMATPFVAIMLLLGISAALRLIVAVVLLPRVKDIDTHDKIQNRRLFYEVLLYRPLGYTVGSLFSKLAFVENRVTLVLSRMNGKNRPKATVKR